MLLLLRLMTRGATKIQVELLMFESSKADMRMCWRQFISSFLLSRLSASPNAQVVFALASV